MTLGKKKPLSLHLYSSLSLPLLTSMSPTLRSFWIPPSKIFGFFLCGLTFGFCCAEGGGVTTIWLEQSTGREVLAACLRCTDSLVLFLANWWDFYGSDIWWSLSAPTMMHHHYMDIEFLLEGWTGGLKSLGFVCLRAYARSTQDTFSSSFGGRILRPLPRFFEKCSRS